MALIQREGRPKLDLTPDATPSTAGWAEHYDNKPMNPLNEAVPERKGKPDINGWQHEAYDVNQVDEVNDKD